VGTLYSPKGRDLWQIRIQRAFGGIIVSVSFRQWGSSLIIVVPSSYIKPLNRLLPSRFVSSARVSGRRYVILGDVAAICGIKQTDETQDSYRLQ